MDKLGKILNVRQVSTITGHSKKKVYSLIRKGEIKARQWVKNGKLFIFESELMEYLKKKN